MISEKYKRAIERAAENVAKHDVRVLCKSEVTNTLVFRASQGSSSCYGFDVVISRFGIMMFGDVGTLGFSVGSSYGLEFLAREKVCGYMISKVEPEFRKKTEIDEVALKNFIYDSAIRLCLEEFLDSDVPDWVDEHDMSPDRHEKRWGELRKLMEKEISEVDIVDDKLRIFLDSYDELFGFGHHGGKIDNGLEYLRVFLEENSTELNLGPEWYETSIDMYPDNLITRLEMLRLMAIKLQEQLNANQGNQPQS